MKIETLADYIEIEARHAHLKAFNASFLQEAEAAEAAGAITPELAEAVRALAHFTTLYRDWFAKEGGLTPEQVELLDAKDWAVGEVERVLRGSQG